MIQVQSDGTHVVIRESDDAQIFIDASVPAADRDAQIAAFMGPPILPVPESITRRQGLLKLLDAGLYDSTLAMVEAAGTAANIEFDNQIWMRNNPVLIQLAGALGLSESMLDQFFHDASLL
jgi:hypothetical protein